MSALTVVAKTKPRCQQTSTPQDTASAHRDQVCSSSSSEPRPAPSVSPTLSGRKPRLNRPQCGGGVNTRSLTSRAGYAVQMQRAQRNGETGVGGLTIWPGADADWPKRMAILKEAHDYTRLARFDQSLATCLAAASLPSPAQGSSFPVASWPRGPTQTDLAAANAEIPLNQTKQWVTATCWHSPDKTKPTSRLSGGTCDCDCRIHTLMYECIVTHPSNPRPLT